MKEKYYIFPWVILLYMISVPVTQSEEISLSTHPWVGREVIFLDSFPVEVKKEKEEYEPARGEKTTTYSIKCNRENDCEELTPFYMHFTFSLEKSGDIYTLECTEGDDFPNYRYVVPKEELLFAKGIIEGIFIKEIFRRKSIYPETLEKEPIQFFRIKLEDGRIVYHETRNDDTYSHDVDVKNERFLGKTSLGRAWFRDAYEKIKKNYTGKNIYLNKNLLWRDVNKRVKFWNREKGGDIKFAYKHIFGNLTADEEYSFIKSLKNLEKLKVVEISSFTAVHGDLYWKVRRSNGQEFYTLPYYYYEKNPLLNLNLDQKAVTAVMNEEILIGMPSKAVKISWGEPFKINRTVAAFGTSEQWIYKFPYGKEYYLYFENDILTSWQE